MRIAVNRDAGAKLALHTGLTVAEHVEIASVQEPLVLGATVEDTVTFLAETGTGRAMLTNVAEPTRTWALAAVTDGPRTSSRATASSSRHARGS